MIHTEPYSFSNDLSYSEKLLYDYQNNLKTSSIDLEPTLTTTLVGFNEFKTAFNNFTLVKLQLKDYSNQLKVKVTEKQSQLKSGKLKTFKIEKDEIKYNLNDQSWVISTTSSGKLKIFVSGNYSISNSEKSLAEVQNEAWQSYQNSDANWIEKTYKLVQATIDNFLVNLAAKNIDEWNESWQNGVSAVSSFVNAAQAYTGSNSLLSSTASAVNQVGGSISSALSTVSTAAKSSASQVSSQLGRLSGKGLAHLKGFTEFKNTYKNNKDPLVKTETKTENDDGVEDLTKTKTKTEVKLKTINLKTSTVFEATDNREDFKETNLDDPKYVVNTYKNAKSDSLICNIIKSTDAMLHYYVSYFFTLDGDNKEHILKLKTPTSASIKDDNKFGYNYFYYFYTDGFEVKPIKKSTTDFNYGFYKTEVALKSPNNDTNFSFSLPHDLEMSFWNFVQEKQLGINLANGVISNDLSRDQVVNLAFILPRSSEDDTVEKFVLENVKFTETSSVDFNQEKKQLTANIKGIYKRLKWYHKYKLLSEETSS